MTRTDRPAVFYFSASDKEQRANTTLACLGPYAVGQGVNMEEAMQDALKRLPPQDKALQDLRDHLVNKTATCEHTVQDDCREPCEYTNTATQVVAVSLESDGAFRSRFDAFCEGNADEESHVRWVQANTPASIKADAANFNGFPIIDWHEITQTLRPEHLVEMEQPLQFLSPEPSSPNETAGRAIDAEVLDILRRCTATDNRLYLPATQLPRKLYDRVNQVLSGLGGKWVGGKTKAHVFEEDVAPILDVAISTGTYITPKDFGYFPTPAALAAQVIDEADIEPGMTVLEPSAGRGGLALPALKACGGNPNLVTVCELLASNVKHLRERGFTRVLEGDFLQLKPEPIFDRVIMNPPFGNGMDMSHLQHAARFLKPTGRLVAITSPSWEHNSNRKSEAFRQFIQSTDAEVTDVAAGTFRSSGTNIATRIIAIEADKLPWHCDSEEDLLQESPAA